MAICRGCGEEIVWMTTSSGKAIPVDIDSVCDIGATAFDPDNMVSHFATCPEASRFRNKKAKV